MSGKRWSGAPPSAKALNPMRMAEPVHRVPPPGATSMASFRSNVSKSSLQLVKEICLHYVEKCAGQYSDNKAAARYVHQMAEEIIFQLGGVANEIKRTRGEPELYQALLDEWNEHFPSSLGAIGSPKAIAQLVASQSKEIQKLKAELETEKINRENDVCGILKSMDAQLHTYRTSVMNDRKQQKVLFDQQLLEADERWKKNRDSYEGQIENLKENHKLAMSELQKQYESLLKSSKEEKEKTEIHYKAVLKQHAAKCHEKKEKLRDRLALWEDKCAEIRGKYNELAMALSEDAISSSDIEPALETDSETDDTDEDVEIDPGDEFEIDVNSTRKMLMERREKNHNSRLKETRPKKERSPRRQSSQPSSPTDNLTSEKLKQLQESNLILTAQIKRLERRLLEADTGMADKHKEIKVLSDKLEEMLTERRNHIKKLAAMEELAESLRRALVVRIDENGKIEFPASDSLQTATDVLCHTPHFLDYPDRTAPLRKSKPILSGYKIPGHF